MALRRQIQRAARTPAGDSADQAWWALGDAPVRVAETLTPLVDGRAAMLAMCAAFLAAKETIWLADWDLHAQLLMVRGRDQRAGADGSPEQEALVERLRAAGLDDAAIMLWTTGQLRVVDVLGFAAGRGVDVRVLLWDPYDPRGAVHMINNPTEQQRLLQACGVQCRLDKSSRSLLHVAQALHQKCSAVDHRIAFVGGVDLTVQYGGDFDRWDTPSHPFDAHTRATDLGPAPHPWHDAQLLLTGAPVRDVERNIRQRWGETERPWWRRFTPPLAHLSRMYLSGERYSGQRALREEEQGKLPPGAGPLVAGASARVQVVRTIPALTYRFAPAGIYGVAQAYTLAARRAECFIYLESQYLWLESFVGVDVRRIGWRSHHTQALLTELAAAAERGVAIAVVLPDHPNCGRAFTDDGIAWLRQHAPRADAAGRLHFFTLATSAPHPDRGRMRYRPIYVHAKVGVVDDRWATIGSANLNSRGMSHDVELNVAALDAEFSRGLRLMLWAEHAGALSHAYAGWPEPAAAPTPKPLAPSAADGLVGALVHPINTWRTNHDDLDPADLARLDDPLAGIELLARRDKENLERLRQGQPLVGQLLPYLPHGESAALGLAVDREQGLLDPLRATREGVNVRHPNRYT
jgi:phosphatidylserine/phosphatidylglycerophosphate/cardiolipin synthase-like enzyme